MLESASRLTCPFAHLHCAGWKAGREREGGGSQDTTLPALARPLFPEFRPALSFWHCLSLHSARLASLQRAERPCLLLRKHAAGRSRRLRSLLSACSLTSYSGISGRSRRTRRRATHQHSPTFARLCVSALARSENARDQGNGRESVPPLLYVSLSLTSHSRRDSVRK